MPLDRSSATPEASSPPCVVPTADQFNWFRTEVHAHERQLKAYIRSGFPTVRDVDDVVQESYFRVWRRNLIKPVSLAKAFLFAIARNIAIDAIRHERRSPIVQVMDLASLDVYIDRDSPNNAEAACNREEAEILLSAIERLSPRTREVYLLRKFHNTPQKEIATKLRISPKTVEAHIGRANKLCERFLRNHGVIRDSEL
jgi:RNA polymerase sigma-70 factor (ECF subfamily)